MSLTTCPWMAARCPHYDPASCKDKESKHCLYVKNSTLTAFTALATLNQLKIAQQQLQLPDPELDEKIEKTNSFLNSINIADPFIEIIERTPKYFL